MPQLPLMDPLPHDPLPATISQGSPMWRLRINGDRMVFCGRTFGVHVAMGLLLVPVVYIVCERFGADRRLQFGLSLFPLFYAGGMVAGYWMMMFAIPRIEYDRSKQRLLLPLGRELPLSKILAVQVIEYLQRRSENSELFTYQLNLCYFDRHKPLRMQLVECHEDETLIRDAQLMASTVGVPLHEYYLTPEALLAGESRRAIAHSKLVWLLMVPGIIWSIGIGVVFWLVTTRLNGPIWFKLLIPTVLLIIAIWYRRGLKRARDRRIARSEQAARQSVGWDQLALECRSTTDHA